MFCPSCRKEVEETAAYCNNCGQNLSSMGQHTYSSFPLLTSNPIVLGSTSKEKVRFMDTSGLSLGKFLSETTTRFNDTTTVLDARTDQPILRLQNKTGHLGWFAEGYAAFDFRIADPDKKELAQVRLSRVGHNFNVKMANGNLLTLKSAIDKGASMVNFKMEFDLDSGLVATGHRQIEETKKNTGKIILGIITNDVRNGNPGVTIVTDPATEFEIIDTERVDRRIILGVMMLSHAYLRRKRAKNSTTGHRYGF